MIFDWMSDPTAWLGLATLVILEIVLGIDNLVFIAILADKLPPHQRNRARMIGLTLAMVMRLGLLASIAWVVTLTQPLFTVLGAEISGRDLILILGGLFLLFKGTMELHERVEGGAGHDAVYMAKLAPTGMIFIPCKDGISHNEIEDAKPEHITAGCNVLLQAMLERAG